MAITKNRQSEETITSMAERAFPDKRVVSIKELTDGMCNVTYDILFHDGSESILKIAAKDRRGNTSNEVNLMQAEINAMADTYVDGYIRGFDTMGVVRKENGVAMMMCPIGFERMAKAAIDKLTVYLPAA